MHGTPINGGNVVSIDANGVIDWKVEKRLQVRGSHDSSVQIRSDHREGWCNRIQFDGNPVKFLQGHNVFGSSDLHGLVIATLEIVLPQVLPPDDVHSLLYLYTTTWCSRLSRVDLTNMYDLGNQQRVMNWLRAAADSANLSYRGRGQFSGDTLYWGKNSRRWSLKMYAKGNELRAHKPKKGLSYHPQYLESVTNYADKALRVELVLRGMELSSKGLESIQYWDETMIDDVYNGYISGLEFSQNMKVITDIKDLEKLPARLRAAALAWSEGHDLRSLYPRATWFRYRKDILATIGLDISLPPPKQRPEPSNVIPLFTIIEAKPMAIPEWAYGTPLLFEPPAYRQMLG